MKILFVGHKDPNHSKAGGYHKVANMPDADYFSDKQALFGFLKPNKTGKIINLFFQQLQTIFKLRKYDIVHFFYGDTLILPFKYKRKCKIVTTVHMNLEQRRRNPRLFLKTLESLDAIICLSSSQQKQLKEKYGLNAFYVPHGFDKPEFIRKNTGIDKDKINLVVSGSNYRDIETLFAAIEYSSNHCPNIRFHLLGQPKIVKDRLANSSNVVCYPRLDDDMYYSVIQDCDYNFLPLTFATANNALLEAQFLGVKSILPSIKGIDDYAAPAPLNYFYEDFEQLKVLLSSLIKCEGDINISQFAEKFMWDNVYPLLNEVYKQL